MLSLEGLAENTLYLAVEFFHMLAFFLQFAHLLFATFGKVVGHLTAHGLFAEKFFVLLFTFGTGSLCFLFHILEFPLLEFKLCLLFFNFNSLSVYYIGEIFQVREPAVALSDAFAGKEVHEPHFCVTVFIGIAYKAGIVTF